MAEVVDETIKAALLQYITDLQELLEDVIDVYAHVDIHGTFPDTHGFPAYFLSRPLEDEVEVEVENRSTLLPRIETMTVPTAPDYPPPHGQNSPAFFPLSCVQAPQIEAGDLSFMLDGIAATTAVTGSARTRVEAGAGAGSGGRFIEMSSPLERERERENELEYRFEGMDDSDDSGNEGDDESESSSDSDDSDDDDDDDDDSLGWLFYGGQMIAAY